VDALAAFLIVGGATALVAAKVKNKSASFEDGSFAVEMTLMLSGAISIAVGLIIAIVANV